MIEAVIFDMDGVLVDSYAPHLESWRRLAEEVGAHITEAQFAETFGRTSREIIRLLFDLKDERRVGAMDDRKEAIYRDIVRAKVPEMPGAGALVSRLVELGFKCAVGSSGPRENVELACAALQLTTRLSATVCGADVRAGKPDPAVFLLAAERMAVTPARCVVVEDAPGGIEAARRAGMRSIALAGTHDAAALADADATVGRLAEVESVLMDWQCR